MMTSEQHGRTLDDLKPDVHLPGNRAGNLRDNPVICHSIDLINQSRLTRLFGSNNGSNSQRSLGMNTLNALSTTTSEMDARYGTDYNVRFLNYLAYIQNNDLTCHGSMSDPCGNRYLPPHRQSHPDLLLHAVKEMNDGIILQGTKACDTSVLNSDEIIIIPTTAMTERDESYALSFALPSDTKGITFVICPESHNMKASGDSIIDRAASAFQNHEALCIFDNVFVPHERIFMYKEHEFSQQMADFFKYSFCFDDS